MANLLFLLFYMLCLSVCAVIALAEYILYGFGLYGMARKAGVGGEWMAFVPYARRYLQGKLGGPITLKGKTMKKPGLWMILLPFAMGVAAGLLAGLALALAVAGTLFHENAMIMIPMASVAIFADMIIFLLLFVGMAAKGGLRALINYQIFSHYCQGNVLVLHIIFSTMLPLYEAAAFFYYRRKPFVGDLQRDA